MYNVSDKYKEQINQNRLHKLKGKIFPRGWSEEIGGWDCTSFICGEVSRYNQCTENSEVFGIGAVYQGEMTFSLKSNGAYTSLYDARVELVFSLVFDDGTEEDVPLGIYYIQEITKNNEVLEIKALDKMSELDIPVWYIEGQSHTFAESMQKITELTGVEFAQTIQEISEIAGHPVWQYYSFTYYDTCREILKEMASIFGGFAFINRSGKIEFKRFDNYEETIEIPVSRRHSLTISDKLFAFGVLHYKSGNGKTISKIYNASNATVYLENVGYIDNYDDSSIQLNGIAAALQQAQFYPGTIEYSGNPAIDIGDYVLVSGIGKGTSEHSELMLVGSDNWTFRGVQTIVSPSKELAGVSGSGSSSGGSGGGVPGKDGFSPSISIYEETDESYILKITNKDGYLLTPNLLKNIIVDSYLSSTSRNPVENRVITAMFEEIRKLLEEIKELIGGGGGASLNGIIQADLLGLSEGISGILHTESEEK